MPLKKVMSQAALIHSARALLLCLAASFLLASSARAELRFDAFLGYDDILPERSWFPITCEIFNDGPAFNAVVEVTAQEYGEGQTRRVLLDLPTNTRKRITIPVFATSRNWNVRLLDERGKVRGEQALQPRRMMKNNLPLIAALARTVAGVPVLPETPAFYNDDSKYLVARLQSSLFPDNPLALEGIDVLYISSEKAVDLNLGQINALMAWLQHGGHLVIGVEQLTDVNAKPWLRELIPCTLSTTVNVSAHQALLEWAHAAVVLPDENDQNRPQPRPRINGQPRDSANPNNNNPNRPRSQPASPLPASALNSADLVADDAQFDATPMQVATGTLRDGKVLIGEPAAPLAITAPRGRGKVTVLTFSPEREPFLSWKNRTWFWAKLADVPSTAFSNPNGVVPANRLSSDGIFRAMIETKQVRKLPLGWLLALLLAYLLVIGPLDQYWLKKINRQMLTWVTFPCYVVFFSALIYFIGFHLRAGELEWNELNVVDILPDSERAVLRGQTYVSIYSPNNEHYKLAGNQKFASLRGQYQGNYGGNQEGGRATVDQTGNNFRADAFVAVWTSELFVSDWVEPSALPADMTVKSIGQGWEVTVNNELDHTLAGVQAVLAGRICALGDVPARQSKTFTVRSGQGSLISELAQKYADPFRKVVGNLRSSFGNNENLITDVPQAATATSFLSYINMTGQQSWNNFTGPANLDLSRFLDKDYAILLAWDAGHSPSALNQFAPKRFHSDTLFRLVVPIKM